MQQFELSEATAARRRFYLHLVDATDGITPETGEAAGQPQISKNGAAFGNTTATLTAIANGAYYVELTAAELDTLAGGMVRYKSANTAEFQDVFQVVAYDPYSATNLGLSKFADIETDTQDIQARLPAALVSGRIDASVGAVAADAITAASIATGAIDADALAADAITAPKLAADVTTELQSGLATAAALATVQADTYNIQTRLPAALVGGRMDSDVAVIQANAVSASALAADAVTEIQSGLALSTQVDALEGGLVTALADLDDIQTRLPAALVSGRIDASVGAMAANVLTAAALATDAVNELADAVLTRDVDQVEGAAAVHSLCSAVLKLVSRFKATTGETFRTNGTTVHMTQTPVNDAVTAISELGVGT